jgi:hypothetical protein
MMELTEAMRQEVALALILWRDFKKGPQAGFDAIMLSMQLGVNKEYDALLGKLPPFTITPRD